MTAGTFLALWLALNAVCWLVGLVVAYKLLTSKKDQP